MVPLEEFGLPDPNSIKAPMDTEIQDFSFTQDLEAAVAVRDRRNRLLRAVVRSTFHQLLDGEWRFAHDPDDQGITDQWFQGHSYRHTLQWPGSIEQHLAAVR